MTRLWGAPSGFNGPSSALGAPREMPSLACWKAPCFIFITQHVPRRRSAGCLGSAEFTYLRGSSALSRELKEMAHSAPTSGSSMEGLLTAASRGPRPARKGAGRGGGMTRGQLALDSWLEPEDGLDAPSPWSSRAGDCLAAGLWVQPSLRAELERDW